MPWTFGLYGKIWNLIALPYWPRYCSVNTVRSRFEILQSFFYIPVCVSHQYDKIALCHAKSLFCTRWIDQHETSVRQRKHLSLWQESNPWPPEHQAGALSTGLRELMESYNLGHNTWNIWTTPPPILMMRKWHVFTPSRLHHCFGGKGGNCSFLFCPRLSEVHTGVTRSYMCYADHIWSVVARLITKGK